MSNHHAWLPPLIVQAEYADWAGYEEALYRVFDRDFCTNPPRFKNYDFKIKRYPLIDGRHATFWHLISSGTDQTSRTIDHDRCARIAWPRKIIDALHSDGHVHSWKAERSGETRLHIALPDYSYVVVLAIRTGYVLLWTAFCVPHEHTRGKYKKEYEAYQATRKN